MIGSVRTFVLVPVVVLSTLLHAATSFAPSLPFLSLLSSSSSSSSVSTTAFDRGAKATAGGDGDGDGFEVCVRLPPIDSGLQAMLRVQPVLDEPSEIVEVRYPVPFGLNVEPRNNLAVCTKDGPGGEKVGDVLRFTSAWAMGLPFGDGPISTAALFAGGVSWQCILFDVMKAERWDEVVEALTSNVEERTEEVVLLFERALPSE